MSTPPLELLGIYPPELCGEDGYPFAWHQSGRIYSGQMADGSVRISEEPHTVYPPIKHLIREQAGYRCLRCGHPYPPGITETCPRGEWTPCDEHCTHGGPVATTHVPVAEIGAGDRLVTFAHWRILTVHHLNEDKADCRWWNLAALCQRCHLRMQRAVVMDRVYHFEHSEWFKPYAAGFYAWKYEGVELTREETMARLDDLLSWELRFRQETLL